MGRGASARRDACSVLAVMDRLGWPLELPETRVALELMSEMGWPVGEDNWDLGDSG